MTSDNIIWNQRTFSTLVEDDRFIMKRIVFDPSGCIVWIGATDGKGYARVTAERVTVYGQPLMHRYILSLKVQRSLHEWELACHTCDRPACICPGHLYIGTHQSNANDKVKRGWCAFQKGEQNPKSKLTVKDVRDVKRLLGLGWDGLSIATEFNVSQSTISDIKTGKTWSHVQWGWGRGTSDNNI